MNEVQIAKKNSYIDEFIQTNHLPWNLTSSRLRYHRANTDRQHTAPTCRRHSRSSETINWLIGPHLSVVTEEVACSTGNRYWTRYRPAERYSTPHLAQVYSNHSLGMPRWCSKCQPVPLSNKHETLSGQVFHTWYHQDLFRCVSASTCMENIDFFIISLYSCNLHWII